MTHILLCNQERTSDRFPRVYIKFPMPQLPEEAMHFLTKIREKWEHHPDSNLREYPLVVSDIGSVGHGPECPGLVLRETIGNLDRTERFDYEVFARCSFGFDRSSKDKGNFFDYDPSGFNRFHIGILVERNFVAEGDERPMDNRRVCMWDEKLNISLRWIDGVFETKWNTGKERKDIHDTRTTYAQSDASYGISDGVGITGVVRRTRASDQELIIGYEDTLACLSQFGDISPQDTEAISRMTLTEGLDFLLDQVLPCAEQFARK